MLFFAFLFLFFFLVAKRGMGGWWGRGLAQKASITDTWGNLSKPCASHTESFCSSHHGR